MPLDPCQFDDDDDGWLVYADELQAAGDPRGELIMVQHRLRATPDDAALRERETELLDDDDLLGPVGAWQPFTDDKRTHGVSLDWRHGFVRRVRVRGDQAPDLAPILLHPSFRMLESLRLAEPETGREQHYADSYVAPIIDSGPHEALRELVIGPDIERGLEWAGPGYVYIEVDISAQYLGNLGALWKATPKLERLVVIGNDVDFGTFHLPELRTFEHITSSLGRSQLKAIQTAHWPKLERLELWFGDGEYGGGDCTVTDIRELLAMLAKSTPQLRELAIANCPLVNEIVQFLDCDVVRRLRLLDLSHGNLRKQGVAALAKLVARLPGLKGLNLAASPLHETELAPLRKAAPHLTIAAGRLSPDRGRYTAVSE